MEHIVGALSTSPEVTLSVKHAPTITELRMASLPAILVKRRVELVVLVKVIACTHEIVLLER